MPRPSLLALTLAVLTAAGPAFAGTLCGTVVDDVGGNPIAQAGVLVHQGGAYTGFHAATDPSGSFCIADIPPGTYLLEIRVDDHLTGWRDNVIVAAETGTVEIPVAVPSVRLGAPWPNPSSAAVKVDLEVSRAASVELSVFDGRGRLVRRWAASHLDPGTLRHEWDGRDHTGRAVNAGLYFLRAHADDTVTTRRVVVIR